MAGCKQHCRSGERIFASLASLAGFGHDQKELWKVCLAQAQAVAWLFGMMDHSLLCLVVVD